MRRFIAVTTSPQALTHTLLAYLKASYPTILKEAYCPCSGAYKACPGTENKFKEAVAGDAVELNKLKMGLSGFKTAISKNKALITEQAAIREFLNHIKQSLNQDYEPSEVVTHIKLIDMAIEILA